MYLSRYKSLDDPMPLITQGEIHGYISVIVQVVEVLDTIKFSILMILTVRWPL